MTENATDLFQRVHLIRGKRIMSFLTRVTVVNNKWTKLCLAIITAKQFEEFQEK